MSSVQQWYSRRTYCQKTALMGSGPWPLFSISSARTGCNNFSYLVSCEGYDFCSAPITTHRPVAHNTWVLSLVHVEPLPNSPHLPVHSVKFVFFFLSIAAIHGVSPPFPFFPFPFLSGNGLSAYYIRRLFLYNEWRGEYFCPFFFLLVN